MLKRFLLWLFDKIGGVVVGSAATAIAQAVYQFATGHPNIAAILLGFAIALGFTVLAFVAWATNKWWNDGFGNTASKHETGRNQPLQLLESPPSGPNVSGGSQKLAIEILEGYVGQRAGNFITGPEVWILLKLRVINHREPAVKIKLWAVTFSNYEREHRGTGYLNAIPRGFTFTPTVPHGIPEEEQMAEVQIDERTSKVSVAFGSHEEGFLLVQTYSPDLYQCFGYCYTVTVTDSLDGVSEGFRVPDEWLKAANFGWPA